MKLRICVLILSLMATGHCNEESKKAKLLIRGNNKFSAKMFSEVANTNVGKSFVLSAFSVLTPLAQLSLASEGVTHDELLSAISLPDDETTISVFSDMNKKFNSIKGIDLRKASKIYVADGFTLDDNYAAVSGETFQSGFQNVDFTKSQKTAQEINNWVENQTNHRIKNLVDPSTLKNATRAVLVNAIYFKGTWKSPFYEDLTRDSDFHVSREKTVKVPMMLINDNFNYGASAELDAKILGIPYEGDESVFYIILPNDVDGITELEKKLQDSSKLDNALNNIFYDEVMVQIPKFKIETTTDLKKILKKVGVSKIFDEKNAKLNKLIKEEHLYISDATQKAFIEINEEGTEAAAANEFDIYPIRSSSFSFVADHPFVFILKTGDIILFSGVYSP